MAGQARALVSGGWGTRHWKARQPVRAARESPWARTRTLLPRQLYLQLRRRLPDATKVCGVRASLDQPRGLRRNRRRLGTLGAHGVLPGPAAAGLTGAPRSPVTAPSPE